MVPIAQNEVIVTNFNSSNQSHILTNNSCDNESKILSNLDSKSEIHNKLTSFFKFIHSY